MNYDEPKNGDFVRYVENLVNQPGRPQADAMYLEQHSPGSTRSAPRPAAPAKPSDAAWGSSGTRPGDTASVGEVARRVLGAKDGAAARKALQSLFDAPALRAGAENRAANPQQVKIGASKLVAGIGIALAVFGGITLLGLLDGDFDFGAVITGVILLVIGVNLFRFSRKLQ